MNPELFGIVFRSASHMHWFVLSLVLLTLHLSFCLFRSYRGFGGWYFIPFHLSTSFSAIVVTRLGTVNGPVYSVDCIWFNLLLGLVHLLIMRLTARRRLHT